jgi:PST family polysaccharide transporter
MILDKDQTNLKRSTIKGVGYLGIASLVANVFGIIALSLLGRKLTAADFGIANLSIVLIRLGQESASFGLETTIIQKKDLDDVYINNCFWGSMIFALFLWVTYSISASLIAFYMKMPQLVNTVPVVGSVILISGLGMIPRSIMERKLVYKKIAFFESLGQITAYLTSIIFVILGIGLWAMIWGFICGELVKTISFWFNAKWHPNLHNISLRISNGWKFGFFVTLDRMLTFFSMQIDKIIIGRILGATALGYYTLAYELIAFPSKRFSSICGRVLLPALSHLQDKKEESVDFFLKAVKYIALFTVPMLIVLAVLSSEVTGILYGDKSDIIGPLVRILSIAGIVFTILTPSGSLLYSKGKPDVSFRWSLLTLIMVGLSVYIGCAKGIYGAAYFVSVAWVILFFVMQRIISRISNISSLRAYKALSKAAIASIIIFIMSSLTKHVVASFLGSNFIIFITTVITSIFAFLIFIFYFEKYIFYFMLKNLRITSLNINDVR